MTSPANTAQGKKQELQKLNDIDKACAGFADRMRVRLYSNAHKGGWEKESVDWLLDMAESNINQARLRKVGHLRALLDAANYIMMAHENAEQEHIDKHSIRWTPEYNR